MTVSETVLQVRRQMDEINQRAFTSRRALRHYTALSGWIDPGEEVAIRHVAAEIGSTRSGALRILDIGIGAGRTVPMMLDVSRDYIGIDMAPKLLAIANKRFPEVDLRVMDARALDFEAARFDLVTFSYNGVDSVDLPDRLRILSEVRRVLAPDGLFVFSALNRDGPDHAPRLAAPGLREGHSPISELLRVAPKAVVNSWNYWRHRRLNQHGENISVSTLSAHSFGVVAIFISVPEQVKQLHEAGFSVDVVYDCIHGQSVAPDQHDTEAGYLHYVARIDGAALNANCPES
ncbi:MAG: class I SAM-dependent methyltransferase [Gemmatimonadaceae bacterium]